MKYDLLSIRYFDKLFFHIDIKLINILLNRSDFQIRGYDFPTLQMMLIGRSSLSYSHYALRLPIKNFPSLPPSLPQYFKQSSTGKGVRKVDIKFITIVHYFLYNVLAVTNTLFNKITASFQKTITLIHA